MLLNFNKLSVFVVFYSAFRICPLSIYIYYIVIFGIIYGIIMESTDLHLL